MIGIGAAVLKCPVNNVTPTLATACNNKRDCEFNNAGFGDAKKICPLLPSWANDYYKLWRRWMTTYQCCVPGYTSPTTGTSECLSPPSGCSSCAANGSSVCCTCQ